ncbi:MAG: type IV pilus assembly protein PilM [Candidatus Liptonbacteria bacterium]|nr:type IV pilus assembly protein PilM [Candidatus Liptonbacteria bacterium]
MMLNLNPLKALFKQDSYLGVDIGTASIKIVELKNAEKKPKLINYASLESPEHLDRVNSAIQTSSLDIGIEHTTALLRQLLDQMKPTTREAVGSLPSFLTFMTMIELPDMPEADLAKAIGFHARQYIPFKTEDVAIDWARVGSYEDESGKTKHQIFVTAVPNEYIRRYQQIFKRAGLSLKALEAESFSIVRSLIVNDPTATIIADIGNRSTNIAVSDQGHLKHNAQIDFAGISLTQAISNGLSIRMSRAEELKKRNGLTALGTGEYELSTLMLPFLDAILTEIQRVKATYEKKSARTVERVVLTGGGARLPGIGPYAEKHLMMPVVVDSPFKTLEYDLAQEPVLASLAPLFSVAVGLGLRELI